MILRTVENELQISVPPDAHSVEGFRRWAHSPNFPDRGRVSLIDGEVVIDMSPERMGSHNKAKGCILAVLYPLVENSGIGDFYADGVLLTNHAAGLSTEPDSCFVRNETWDSGRVVVVAAARTEDDGIELEGTPDWVLEVVSPNSVGKDTERLMEAYFRAGIPEYWLIDVRNEPIRFDVYVRGEEGYVATAPRDGWGGSPIFEREFRLECERRSVGRWRYQLHICEAAP
jgi:Uma2 family endonuclease